MRAKETEAETIDAGSGDVLVDLGFPDAGERKLRVKLAMQLNELLAARLVRQVGVAQMLGNPKSQVSELKHYKLNRFYSQSLLHLLALLEQLPLEAAGK